MKPDQIIYTNKYSFYKKKFKIKTVYGNLVTANLINTYNIIIFLFHNFIKNSQILVLLILLNLSLYMFNTSNYLLLDTKIYEKKIALIFGVTGQDGSLSQFLLKKAILYME